MPGEGDQQDRRGLAPRRRLHPRRRGRHGHQHADRQRRPRRRLRDPHRGRPPRDPLHHDDDRGLGRGRARSRPQREQRTRAAVACRSCTGSRRSPVAPGGRVAADPSGSSAPLGRRALRGRRHDATPAAIGSSRRSTRGPEPGAGPVLHARRRARLGRRAEAAPTCSRAFSVAGGRGGCRRGPARLPARGGRARDRPARPRLEPGRGAVSRARSAGRSPPRPSSPPAPPGRSSSAAGSGSRRWRILRRRPCRARRPDAGPARLSRRAALRAASSSSTARRCASPARTATPGTRAT